MSKKTQKTTKIEATQPQEVSKELQNKVGSIRALATAHNLIQKGYFPHGYNAAIEQSLAFLQALHEQVVAEAIQDPQADLVPEIQALKQAATQSNETTGVSNEQN